MSSKVEKFILKKTNRYAGAKMRRTLEEECKKEGFSTDEIDVAIEKLIREGLIYVCRTDEFIKRV